MDDDELPPPNRRPKNPPLDLGAAGAGALPVPERPNDPPEGLLLAPPPKGARVDPNPLAPDAPNEPDRVAEPLPNPLAPGVPADDLPKDPPDEVRDPPAEPAPEPERPNDPPADGLADPADEVPNDPREPLADPADPPVLRPALA